MNKPYSKAIREILRFRRAFDRIDHKMPKKLVGDLGEFYVLQKFEKLGLHPEHRGGQGGYDIYLKSIKKRIEVRTSLWKNEGVYPDPKIRFWGWRVENFGQKRNAKFDYLVGVGLDDRFADPQFYIFTHKEAFSVGIVVVGRFKNIKRKIHLFENRRAYQEAVKLKPKLVSPFERRINTFPARFQNQWRKIK